MTLFFYGPNTYALRQQLTQMTAAYVAKTGSDYGLERVDGVTAKPRELAATLQASPFLANTRLVIISGLATNKAAAAKLSELMSGVPSTTVAVFVEQEVDQRTAAFKALKAADKVMKFEALSGPQLTAWVKQGVEKLGGSIDRPAIQELLTRVGEDQWRLAQEINKMVNYSQTVTAAGVRSMVAASVDQSVFDLVEAMTAGRVDAALKLYRGLLEARESEMYLLTMVQWQLRNLLLAKTAPGLDPPELAKVAGMSPYVAGKMLSAQSRYSEGLLRAAYRAAADCELDIKSGRLKPEAAVEQLIFRVANAYKH